MNQIKLGSWIIEIHTNTTKAFYENHHLINNDCNCHSCANYVMACSIFPQEIKDIFNTLGIDPRREGEVYEIKVNNDGTYLYGGFYHIVGRIIDGSPAWTSTTENRNVASPNFHKLNGIAVGFSKKLALVPKDFPMPIIQFEFLMDVPWLLR